MDFLTNICTLLGVSENDFNDPSATDGKLIEAVRNTATEHLNKGTGTIAKTFRGKFLPPNIAKKFFPEKAPSPGTYVEATALGEYLGCHVVVINESLDKPVQCLYRADEKKPPAPTIELHINSEGLWMVQGRPENQGLYKAFVDALRILVYPELLATKMRTISKSHDEPTQIKSISEIKAERLKISECVKHAPLPKDTELRFQAEKSRIAKLPIEEQKRIASDHLQALKEATHPMSYQNDKIFYYVMTDAAVKDRFKEFCDEYEKNCKKTEGGSVFLSNTDTKQI